MHRALLASVLLASCSSSMAPADAASLPELGSIQGSPLPVTRVYRSWWSGYGSQARLVVANGTEWSAVWDTLQQGMMTAPMQPTVDFNQRVVILAGMGRRMSGGYTIEVDSARSAGQDVEVFVSETSPGATCVSLAVLTQPVDVVTLAPPAGSIRFVERALVREC